jgi:hypothetical protein
MTLNHADCLERRQQIRFGVHVAVSEGADRRNGATSAFPVYADVAPDGEEELQRELLQRLGRFSHY